MIRRRGTTSSSRRCPLRQTRLTNWRCRGVAVRERSPRFVFRDHWEEMFAKERDWCVNRICQEVMESADHWHPMARVQWFDVSADRPCAWIVSALLTKSLPQPHRSSVQEAVAAAVTHPVNEVRWHAVWVLLRI